MAGVQLDEFAGLGVLDRDDAEIRQRRSRASSIGRATRSWRRFVWRKARRRSASDSGRLAAGLEIREQKDDRAALDHVVHEIERLHEIGAAPLRFEAEHFAHDAQHVAAAFARRHVELDLIGEEKQADLVAVLHGGEGEHARDLRRQLALALRARAEVAGRAHVHHEEKRELAFLDELLHERAAGPRGHVPVDRAHFVAGHVFAHRVEVHAAAFEDAVVLTGERIGHEPVGADFDLPHLLEDFAGLFGVHGQVELAVR